MSLASGESYVTELNENDVLFGRGSGPNDHEGNVRFRLLVSERKVEYMATSHRQTKARIAREIVDSVLAKNGRFLKKAEPEESKLLGIPAGVDAWLIVDDDTVMEKAKQALRQNREKEKPAIKAAAATSLAAAESKAAKAEPSVAKVKVCPKPAAPTKAAAPVVVPPPAAPNLENPFVAVAPAAPTQGDLFAAYGVASMPGATMPLRGHIEAPRVSASFAPQMQNKISMQQQQQLQQQQQQPGSAIPNRGTMWGNYETNYGISQQAIQPSQRTFMQTSLQHTLQQQATLHSPQQSMESLQQRAALQQVLQQQQVMPPPLPVHNDIGRNTYDDGGRLRYTSDNRFNEQIYQDDNRRESLQVQDLTASFHHMKTVERNNVLDPIPRNYDSSDTMGTIDPIPMGSSSVGMSVASMSSSTLSVLKGAFGESMASHSFGDDDGGGGSGGTGARRGSVTRPPAPAPAPQEVTSQYRPPHAHDHVDVSLRFSQVFWTDKTKAGILAIAEEIDEHDNESDKLSDPRPLSIMQDAPDNLSSLGQSSLSIMKAAFEGGMGSSNETYGSPMQEGNNSDVSSQMISSNDGQSSGLSSTSMGASSTNCISQL